MIGQIESYDPDTQAGIIKGEKALFTFQLEDWAAEVPPDEGDEVNFDAKGTIASNINLQGACLEPPKAVKYKYVAVALGLFLGWLGIHRLYLGFYRLGIMQIGLTAVLYMSGMAGFAALWGFIEVLLLVGGQIHKDAKGRPLK